MAKRGRPRIPLAWEVDPDTGCWTVTSHKGTMGYIIVWDGRKPLKMHREAWEAMNGPIPDGMFVCHKCDNTRCINPDHLFVGTSADNTRDMVEKGRQARGEHHPSSRLTAEQAKYIWEHREVSVTKLMKMFNISAGAVSHVRGGRNWAHVHEGDD